ncbi:MarP family serine protease [Nocardioides acrostichi]|uniref:MarP family serine protease n=1 Tax=Nocardioides acrostichi TaxID=2784339 RepID=A0A930UYI7_9ACTN|nr:MarP family serine protease [Nocardioides acrostichi]MBF4163228.1 MarP family serine protease [Nocardioides acrostichi]
MNLLDWLLVLLVVAYALSGYWQGFITGAAATAGLLLGGFFGIWLAPLLLGDASPSLVVSLGALFIVIVAASLGQALFQYAGAKLRSKITWQPVRAVDAIGGAALSAAAVLLVAWALGVAVSGTRIAGLTPLVRSSAVLAEVNGVLPTSANKLLTTFNSVVGTSFFPDYLEPFATERIVNVPPGNAKVLQRPAVRAVESSVLKIRGTNSCGSGVEGSGFVFAPGRVMTNAHVVAGVTAPTVQEGEATVPARVVYYNPDVDIAVLALDTGSSPALEFATAGEGDNVVIAGYPQDGPYDVRAGRIRAQQRLRSPNIYGNGTVIREVFSLRGLVRPGNSGGPLVDPKGDVVGVVFAASVTDGDTGYALTSDQVQQAASQGEQNDQQVSTGGCAS